MKDRIKALCKKEGISMNALEKKLNFGSGYISKLKDANPNISKLSAIAEYFGVSVDYLLGKEEKEEKPIELTQKDERDIARDLENIRRKLQTGEEGVASFEGVDIPLEDQELFLGQVELMLKRLKAINKVKYNPHKNGN